MFHVVTALRGTQEFVGFVVFLPAWLRWGGSCDCSFLEGGVGVLVDVRCLGRLVADHSAIVAMSTLLARRSMALVSRRVCGVMRFAGSVVQVTAAVMTCR